MLPYFQLKCREGESFIQGIDAMRRYATALDGTDYWVWTFSTPNARTRFSPMVAFTELGTAVTVEKVLLTHRHLEIEATDAYTKPRWQLKDHDMAEDLAVTFHYHLASPGALHPTVYGPVLQGSARARTCLVPQPSLHCIHCGECSARTCLVPQPSLHCIHCGECSARTCLVPQPSLHCIHCGECSARTCLVPQPSLHCIHCGEAYT
jgi:hypothetical protein